MNTSAAGGCIKPSQRTENFPHHSKKQPGRYRQLNWCPRCVHMQHQRSRRVMEKSKLLARIMSTSS